MLIIISAWFIVIFYTVIAALPTNAISLTLDQKNSIKVIYPQGWGFFSKDPRSETVNVYKMENYEQATTWPNNNIHNSFGLYRYGRSQGVELGLIVSEIPNTANWSKCEEGSKTCLSKLETQTNIKNSTPVPTLCGELGIAREKLVPWAWSKYNNQHVSKNSTVIRVNVKCQKK